MPIVSPQLDDLTYDRVVAELTRRIPEVNVFARVQLVVVAHGINVCAGAFFDVRPAFFAALVPDVGDSHELEVEIFRVLQK